MSAPPAIDACPLTASVRPLSSVAPSNTLDIIQLKALISQALQLYRSSSTWPSSKTFNLDYESKVIATKGLSAQSGRLKDTAWHARCSEHSPSQSHKLNYQDFYEGLAVDHPIKEKQYIHDILTYDQVGPEIQLPSTLESDPFSKYISTVRANVWTSEYKLPMVVSDRDFVELFLTVEFKPHADPLSSSHIDSILAALKEGAVKVDESEPSSTLDTSADRRSCLNIQLPVETPDCKEKKAFVRAYYGSVEVLKELEQQGTEWWMAVQSDSSGRVPLMFQEMSMPSKVAPDVPLFIGWATKQKQST